LVERRNFALVLLDNAQANAMGAPRHCEHDARRKSEEPCSLVVRGRDAEIYDGTRLIPDTAVVARDHTETVAAGRQVAVEGLPSVVRVLPLAIVTFEHVPESHLFWRSEAQRRVV